MNTIYIMYRVTCTPLGLSNMAASVEGLTGYDHQFLEPPPDDLLCLICLCVARDPQQINCCGKVLCNTCLKEHKKRSTKCPQCNVNIDSFEDKRGQRMIRSLRTLCDNSSNGCEWIGELRHLDKHSARCGFTLLPCPNECRNRSKVVQLLRKDLEKHTQEECPRRQYECLHCQEEGEYREMTTKHLSKCSMLEVPCPKRRCKASILRRDLPKHREECHFEKVPCKYSTIGCDKEVERKDLEEHEGDTEQHLQLALNTVHQQQNAIRDIEQTAEQQQNTIRDMQAQSRKMPMTFKFTNFNQHKTAHDAVYSPAFYTSPKGYKICICVYANGNGDGKDTHVSVFAHLMNGENDDFLQWPFIGTVVFKLLNQLEDKNHHSLSVTFPSDSDTSERVINKERSRVGWGTPKYISHSDLGHKTAKNCQYLKDDRLVFKISADAQGSPTPWLI